MTVWCVIPAKPFEDAKTRLAPVLDAAARRCLAERLFRRTCDMAVRQFGPAAVVVVSRSANVLNAAQELGALPLQEGDALDMNQAITLGAARAVAAGATALLVVSTDLPLLEQHDFVAMTAHAGQSALAPDRHESGTNAMFWAHPPLAPYSFGPDSFQRHQRAINALGRQPRIVRRPGLALDIDDVADLQLLQNLRQNDTPRGSMRL